MVVDIVFFKNLKSALLIQSPKIKSQKHKLKLRILAFEFFYYDPFRCLSHL